MTDLLILSNESDYSLDRVIYWLQHNAPELAVLRINRENANEVPCHSAILDRGGWSARTAPRVAWLRQFLPERDPYGPVLSPDEIDDVLIRRRQWLEWLHIFDCLGTQWMNHPESVYRAESKVRQLASAVRLNFETPRTLITYNQDEARAFASDVGPCIIKSVATAFWEFSDQSFVFTMDAEKAFTVPANSWQKQPIFVQEKINGSEDARLFIIGQDVLGGRRLRSSLDWRTDPSVAWTSWYPDEITVKKVRAFAEEFHLDYGAFDFILGSERHEGPVFLECNPSGEFGFLDDVLAGEPSALIGAFLAQRSLD